MWSFEPLFAADRPQSVRTQPNALLSGGFFWYNEQYDSGAVDELFRSIPEENRMDEASLEGALNELVKQFGESADPNHRKLAELARQAESNRKELQKSIDTLQELLDYLRVCIKYQAFDLEATRRENDYLRKLLEESNRDDK
jgi:hypothetical protein